MFRKFTVNQLKALIKQFKEHHTIRNYSKLRKAQLVAQLESRFEIRDNQLYLKNAPATEPKAIRVKKTIVPTVVSDAPQRQDGLTAGQQRYKNAVSSVEKKAVARENYKIDSSFAKRLRGKM
jgi:hypothetical protein